MVIKGRPMSLGVTRARDGMVMVIIPWKWAKDLAKVALFPLIVKVQSKSSKKLV